MVLLVVTGGTLWLARKSFTQPGPLGSDKAVFIPKGSGVSDIADTLARAGVISSVYLFIGPNRSRNRSCNGVNICSPKALRWPKCWKSSVMARPFNIR